MENKNTFNVSVVLPIKSGKTLGFTTITNLTLFNVTNARIIDFDFSNEFNNSSSTNYKTLCYQAFKASSASVIYFIVYTLSKFN